MYKFIQHKVLSMRISSMTIIFSLVFFAIIFSGIFFRDPLLSTAFKWYLERYCHQCCGADAKLYIDSIEKNEGAWVIKKPMVTKETDQEISIHFVADQITVDFSLALLDRKLNLDIKVDGLKLNVYDQRSSLKKFDYSNLQALTNSSSLLRFTPPTLSFLRLNANFKNIHGEFSLFTPDINKSIPFFYEEEALPSNDSRLTVWLQEDVASVDNISFIFNPSDDKSLQWVQVDCCSVECSTVNEILKSYKPIKEYLTGLNVKDGCINGSFTIHLPKDQDIYLEGDLDLELLAFDYKPMQLKGAFPKAHLQLSKASQVDANFPESLGKIIFSQPAEVQFSVHDQLLEVHEITGDFILYKKNAELALQGTCWGNCWQTQKNVSNNTNNPKLLLEDIKLSLCTADRILTLDCIGHGKDLIPLLPEKFIASVSKQFQQDRLLISADAGFSSSEIKFEGALKFFEGTFKFDDDDELITPEEVLLTSEKVQFAFTLEKAQDSSGAFILKDGNFKAVNLPLQKYASPFIFPKDQLQLTGRGSCIGQFDRSCLTLHYQAEDVLLNSDYFALNVDDIAGGHHYFDFDNDKNMGTIPLWNAKYLEKNSDLLFTGIQAKVYLEPENIHIDVTETFCNEVYFTGDVDIDFENNYQGAVNVVVIPHNMQGSFSQVQSLFANFKKPLLPMMNFLEGNVGLNQNVSSLHFSLQPNGVVTKAKIQGIYTDGKVAFPDLNLNLQELSFNFDYDLEGGLLSCSDIQGSFLVGSSKDADEYMLVGDYVRFTDSAQEQIEFDLWVGDKSRDILRLVGKSSPVHMSTSDDSYVQVSLDHELSHFGSVHPDPYFSLKIKEWSEIKSFYLRFDLQLDKTLNDIQRLSKTGLLCLSPGLLKELNSLKTAQGDFDVICRYKQDTGEFLYETSGRDVSIGSYEFRRCSLKGKKSGNKWSIEQLKLDDDLSIAADFSKVEKEIDIHFLGIRYGGSYRLGLEGKYFLENHQFSGKVNLLEANLIPLHKLLKQEQLSFYKLRGDIRASGTIQGEWLDHKPTLQWQMELNAAVRGAGVRELWFQDIENLKCFCTSGEGITLNQIETSLKDQHGTIQGLIALEKLEYNPSAKTVNLNGLHFDVSSEYLSDRFNFYQKTISNGFYESIFNGFYSKPMQVLAKSKAKNNLGGTLNLTTSPAHTMLTLNLKDGSYQFGDDVYELNNSIIECDANELRLNSECFFKEHPYQISLHTKLPAIDTGNVCIKDRSSEYPLNIEWQASQNGEIVLSKVQGICSGITFSLNRPNDYVEKETYLVGNVSTEAVQKTSLIDRFETLKDLDLKGKYCFMGRWLVKDLNLLSWSKLKDIIQFKGSFEFNHCEFKGYELDQLSGKLEYSPENIVCHNFCIKDVAGGFCATDVQLSLDQQQEWVVTIPCASMTLFKPSLLRGLNAGLTPKHASFMVSTLDLKDFSGCLFKPETYRGKGAAYCHNSANEGAQEPSTSVTNHLIDKESSLDVELALLRPMYGTVHFDIDQEKIFFTLFEDVYSFGKHSKFYLFEDPERSYIDFNGNLSIHARIKQRNLLLKFAELLTVSVTGSLFDPIYSFSRNKTIVEAKKHI